MSFTKIQMVAPHWLSAYSVHSHTYEKTGRSKGMLGLGFLSTRSWHMALDLEQDSQLEGATQDQLCLMPLRIPLPHTPLKGQDQAWAACSIRRLDQSEGNQMQEARMRHGHFWMGIGEELVNRCSGHRDLSGSKTRMGQAQWAMVRPEPAGSRVRKDIRSGWTIAQR